jgi:hypothetical protein
MRCPRCDDDYETDVTRCAHCRVPLVGDDDASSDRSDAARRRPADLVPDAPREVRLGSFHPAVVERVRELLYRRGIEHRVVERDDEVEIHLDRRHRDDVRTELTLDWDDVVHHLDEVAAPDVLAHGGNAPGWFDAPQGGHIDRTGRLVVDADDADDWETSRIVGPGLLAGGLVIGVTGWWMLDSGALVALGIAMVLLGVFLPR